MTEPLNYRQRRGHGGARKGAGRSPLVSKLDLLLIGALIASKARELQTDEAYRRLRREMPEYFEASDALKDNKKLNRQAFIRATELTKRIMTLSQHNPRGTNNRELDEIEAELAEIERQHGFEMDQVNKMTSRFDPSLMVPATRDAHEAKTNIRTSPLPKGDWVIQARKFVRQEWQKKHGVTLSNWQLRKATQTYRAALPLLRGIDLKRPK